MAGIIGVLRIMYNTAWPLFAAAAILFGLAILPRVQGWADRLPPSRAVLWILLAPLAVIVWGGANWGAEENRPAGAIQWRSYVLLALAIGAIIIAIAVPIRYRRAPRSWVLISCSLTALLLTALATFIGGMAIVNDWL